MSSCPDLGPKPPGWPQGHTSLGEGNGHQSRPCDPGHQNALSRVGGKKGWQKEPAVLKEILVPRLRLLSLPFGWEGEGVLCWVREVGDRGWSPFDRQVS